jgi:hypothetical protein
LATLPASRPVTRQLGERVGDPVGDEHADVRQVIQADVLGAALGRREHAELPLRAVHRLLVGAVRVRDRDLPVVLAVRD